MTKTTIITAMLMVLFLLAGNGIAADLVSHWEFEGNANDSAGTNHGTMHGGSFTNGVIGQALLLDGIDEYVVGTSSPYDFEDTTFTVAAWFKTTVPGWRQMIVSEGGYHDGGWLVDIDNRGGVRLMLKEGSRNSFNAYDADTDSLYNDGNWHHAAVIVTTDTSDYLGNSASIFIDGSLVSIFEEKDHAYSSSNDNWAIGTRGGGLNSFNGSIDDVRIYNGALSAEEVQQLYEQGNCLQTPEPRVPYGPDPCDGAVGVPIDTKLVWNGGGDDCSATCNLDNGGFESGNFAPWVAVTGLGDELTPWSITGASSGYFGNGFPFEGSSFAQNGFDGEAGLYYDLYQEITIPPCASSAVLNWSERIQWNMFIWGATLPRDYEVSVQPAGGGTPLAVLYAMQLLPGTNGDTGYVSHSIDLLSAAPGIAGQTVRINFHEYIPETYTGPAQFDLDGISLNCGGSVTPSISENSLLAQQAGTPNFANYDVLRKAALASQNMEPGIDEHGSLAMNPGVAQNLQSEPEEPSTYDVYFGTEDPPLELIAGDLNEPTFYPGLLDCDTMYYWQVVAKNSCWSTPGPVWSFTTISCPALVSEVIGEKLEMLERIPILLEKEQIAYKGFEELLESGDYGDLKKGDIVKAKQKIHSAMQHEEQAEDALEKSVEKLDDAINTLGQ